MSDDAPSTAASTPHRRRTLLLVVLLLLLAQWLLQHPERWPTLPYRWNPWAPLQLDAPPDALLRHRLAALERDPAACRAALAQAPMQLRALPDRITGPGCGFSNALHIRRTSVAVAPAFSLSCRAAVSLALWERHVLQRAAREHLDAEVVRIEHLGSYACRNINGREAGRRSQHATADAFDIAGVVLRDGRRVRVLSDWRSETPGRAAFLQALRDGACTYFDAVLGPDYNAAHRDHFHFDRGHARICR